MGHPIGAVSWRGLGRTQGGCSLWHVQHADDKHRHPAHTFTWTHTRTHTHRGTSSERHTLIYVCVCTLARTFRNMHVVMHTQTDTHILKQIQ